MSVDVNFFDWWRSLSDEQHDQILRLPAVDVAASAWAACLHAMAEAQKAEAQKAQAPHPQMNVVMPEPTARMSQKPDKPAPRVWVDKDMPKCRFFGLLPPKEERPRLRRLIIGQRVSHSRIEYTDDGYRTALVKINYEQQHELYALWSRWSNQQDTAAWFAMVTTIDNLAPEGFKGFHANMVIEARHIVITEKRGKNAGW